MADCNDGNSIVNYHIVRTRWATQKDFNCGENTLTIQNFTQIRSRQQWRVFYCLYKTYPVEGYAAPNKSLDRGRYQIVITAMVGSRGESLSHRIIQMKLFNAIAATAVIGGSLIATAAPASAQYYGNSNGYNNSIQQGYGNRNNPYDVHMNRNNLYTNSREKIGSQKINSYGRSSTANSSFTQKCAGYAC